MEKEFEAYLNGDLTEKDRKLFEADLEKSPELMADFRLFKMLWEDLSELPVPEPSQSMKNGFEDLLAKEIKARNNTNLWKKWIPGIGMAAAILLAGVWMGILWQKNESPAVGEVATLTQEVKELKEMMMLQMIKNPMATERLKAVSLSSELPDVNKTVIEALFTTLNYDENDNVRLVTLETLAQWADRPEVREELIKSMAHQESPLVQLSMADLMIRLQEKRALEPINNLLKKHDLNPAVKEQLESTARQLKII